MHRSTEPSPLHACIQLGSLCITLCMFNIRTTYFANAISPLSLLQSPLPLARCRSTRLHDNIIVQCHNISAIVDTVSNEKLIETSNNSSHNRNHSCNGQTTIMGYKQCLQVMHVSFPETIRNVHDERIVNSPEIYRNNIIIINGNEALQKAITKIKPLLQLLQLNVN